MAPVSIRYTFSIPSTRMCCNPTGGTLDFTFLSTSRKTAKCCLSFLSRPLIETPTDRLTVGRPTLNLLLNPNCRKGLFSLSTDFRKSQHCGLNEKRVLDQCKIEPNQLKVETTDGTSGPDIYTPQTPDTNVSNTSSVRKTPSCTITGGHS